MKLLLAVVPRPLLGPSSSKVSLIEPITSTRILVGSTSTTKFPFLSDLGFQRKREIVTELTFGCDEELPEEVLEVCPLTLGVGVGSTTFAPLVSEEAAPNEVPLPEFVLKPANPPPLSFSFADPHPRTNSKDTKKRECTVNLRENLKVVLNERGIENSF